jgi:hypothetical protein
MSALVSEWSLARWHGRFMIPLCRIQNLFILGTELKRQSTPDFLSRTR